MKVIALVVALAVSGCAFAFQERLPSQYAGNTTPYCSTTRGWYLWDFFAAASNVAVAGSVNTGDAGSAYFIGAAILHLISGAAGSQWRTECEDARAAYETQPQQITIVRHVEPARRGFFCADSPRGTVLCRRDQLDCERDREVASVATPDIGACTAVPSVWCVTGEDDKSRCYSSKHACVTSGAGDVEPRCLERR